MIILPLNLSRVLRDQINREGIAAYPNECCGIIYGRDVDNQRIVDKLEAVENSFESAEQYHRFSITPKNLMDAEKSAAASGLLVLGFYHSHPDHPARPSETDRLHAWPFYSYIVVAIAGGQACDMTSWSLDESTETFSRQDIVETN